MEKQKRKARAYKTTDYSYKKAMKRAKRDKISLARLIEALVISYGDPNTGLLVKKDGLYNGLTTVALDINTEREKKEITS